MAKTASVRETGTGAWGVDKVPLVLAQGTYQLLLGGAWELGSGVNSSSARSVTCATAKMLVVGRVIGPRCYYSQPWGHGGGHVEVVGAM